MHELFMYQDIMIFNILGNNSSFWSEHKIALKLNIVKVISGGTESHTLSLVF